MISKEQIEACASNMVDSARVHKNDDDGIIEKDSEDNVVSTASNAPNEAQSQNISHRVPITVYEEVVLNNRRADVDNDATLSLATTLSSSAHAELMHCRTALSGTSVPFRHEVHKRIDGLNSKGGKCTLFYVNSCYPGETPQLPNPWQPLSSTAEPKFVSANVEAEDETGKGEKYLQEEKKRCIGNEEVPDTIPFISVPSTVLLEGMPPAFIVHFLVCVRS